MTIYKNWDKYLEADLDNYLDPENAADEDTHEEYEGYRIDGKSDIFAFTVTDANYETIAILENATLEEVKQYIDTLA